MVAPDEDVRLPTPPDGMHVSQMAKGKSGLASLFLSTGAGVRKTNPHFDPSRIEQIIDTVTYQSRIVMERIEERFKRHRQRQEEAKEGDK